MYPIIESTHVLVLTYGCTERSERTAVVSDEHTHLEWFTLADVSALRMPDGYKSSIAQWTRATAAR